jgi:hypothetical protein
MKYIPCIYALPIRKGMKKEDYLMWRRALPRPPIYGDVGITPEVSIVDYVVGVRMMLLRHLNAGCRLAEALVAIIVCFGIPKATWKKHGQGYSEHGQF